MCLEHTKRDTASSLVTNAISKKETNLVFWDITVTVIYENLYDFYW